MLKIYLTVGIPACGKSTWAKEEVRKDPEGTTRINRDDLRNMMSNYHFSDSNEKLVTDVSNAAIKSALKKGRNIILDETNINRRNFDNVCKIAKELNIDCMVMEKPFFISLEEAVERDSKRLGSGKVGEKVIKDFWKKSGGEGHKFYKPRVEVFKKGNALTVTLEQDKNLPKAIICDLDGTLAIIGDRSPYDAKDCDLIDFPNLPVIETVKLYYQNNYNILFCSGREDKYKPETCRFIEKYLPDTNYKLFMRKSDDQRKDSIIKSEIFNDFIKDQFNVLLVLDDRNQVVEFWRTLGLTCFQVAPGDF